FDAHPKGDGVVFAPEAFVKVGGAAIPPVFVAIGKKMFHQRGCLPVAGVIALETVDISLHQRAIEEGVFAITFFGSAPAWVAAEVGIRGADDEAAFAKGLIGIPRFISFNRGRLPDQRGIPGLCHTDRLRKDSGCDGRLPAPATGDAESEAVQTFAVAGAF